MTYPEAPVDDGTWNPKVKAYGNALNRYVVDQLNVAMKNNVYWKAMDKLRHASTLIRDAVSKEDHEMVFVYGDWLNTTTDGIAIRSTVLVLRDHHEGSIRHLLTPYKIEACGAVTDALTKRGRTNWENNRECAYLAFDDPSLLPKILYLVENGVFALFDMKDRLDDMKEVPVPLIDGAL